MTSTLQPIVSTEVHQLAKVVQHPSRKAHWFLIHERALMERWCQQGGWEVCTVSSISINDEVIPLEPAAFHCTAGVQQPHPPSHPTHHPKRSELNIKRPFSHLKEGFFFFFLLSVTLACYFYENG